MSLVAIAHYIAPIIGLSTIIIGICAVLQPQPMSKKFGITVSGAALPYVVSTGIRDVFIGLTVLVLFYRQEWSLLGVINLLIGVVAISDFLVVKKHGDKKTSLAHLAGAVGVVAYGAWLLS